MSLVANLAKVVKTRKEGEFAFEAGDWGVEYAALYEFLARQMVEGKPREPSHLGIFSSEGMACLCLSDRHSGLVCFHKAETIGEALTALDERLGHGRGDWRTDKRNGRQ